ncbi:MgtC/SapB family protein [Abyssibacter sp.]|uniref:MgtC/SapB family protein n=1 Tax=Abyssibacter sp. TaxID=2320200 RepID=UPI0025BE5F28|nr:MgtC/SapB family protein [Abyssibacter sp.]MCK5859770.1 MgtC/SapB family protein [Abyssibacter sp.]
MIQDVVIPEAILVGKVAVAMALAGIIGFERETDGKAAGFRTHMLVGGAAALLVGSADLLIDRFGADAGNAMRTDPIRVVEAIVAGVSFLGAGTIFVSGQDRVRGLTTAASLLMVAGVGVIVAVEAWIVALSVTLLTLFTLHVLGGVGPRKK